MSSGQLRLENPVFYGSKAVLGVLFLLSINAQAFAKTDTLYKKCRIEKFLNYTGLKKSISK